MILVHWAHGNLSALRGGGGVEWSALKLLELSGAAFRAEGRVGVHGTRSVGIIHLEAKETFTHSASRACLYQRGVSNEAGSEEMYAARGEALPLARSCRCRQTGVILQWNLQQPPL